MPKTNHMKMRGRHYDQDVVICSCGHIVNVKDNKNLFLMKGRLHRKVCDGKWIGKKNKDNVYMNQMTGAGFNHDLKEMYKDEKIEK